MYSVCYHVLRCFIGMKSVILQQIGSQENLIEYRGHKGDVIIRGEVCVDRSKRVSIGGAIVRRYIYGGHEYLSTGLQRLCNHAGEISFDHGGRVSSQAIVGAKLENDNLWTVLIKQSGKRP